MGKQTELKKKTGKSIGAADWRRINRVLNAFPGGFAAK